MIFKLGKLYFQALQLDEDGRYGAKETSSKCSRILEGLKRAVFDKLNEQLLTASLS